MEQKLIQYIQYNNTQYNNTQLIHLHPYYNVHLNIESNPPFLFDVSFFLILVINRSKNVTILLANY
ncbi:MAG: hypothetical protein ACI8RD_000628 [Bacillariaceae sp.]|jgi:hypothetical protein